MSDDAITVIESQPEPETSLVPQFHAVAVNATEMAASKLSIKTWLEQKILQLGSEIAQTEEAYESAIKHKWKASTFKSSLSRLKQKHLYYGKLLAAVHAGFTIVPNMPVDVFAIRVLRGDPKWRGNHGNSTYSFSSASPSVPDEQEQRLPVGEGRYESPLVDFYESNTKNKEIKDGKVVDVYHVSQFCKGFQEIEFPLAVAHPLVMDATAQAMAMKIFDRIGVVPETQRRGYRGDPIVLGQITRKEGWQTKTASFLIAWYLDVRTL